MSIVYEVKTDKSLDEAIKSVEENLKENSFGILWQMNFKETLEGKGLEFEEDFVVLEVCNPQQAKAVLEVNSHVGYVLPCKMVVRTDKGQTYIGMTNPQALIGLFDQPELDEVAEKVANTLKKAIEASI